jgi:cell division protein FtsI (penicillin-binding protein 3)
MIGVERQQEFLTSWACFEPTPLEIVEAPGAPLLPPRWSELSTMTISYGHGLSTSPLHLARPMPRSPMAARKVTPTLLRPQRRPARARG